MSWQAESMPSQRFSSLDILFHLTMAVKIDTLNHTTVSVRDSVAATELGIWTSQVLIPRFTVAEWCTWTPHVVHTRTQSTISTPFSYIEGPDSEMRRKYTAGKTHFDHFSSFCYCIQQIYVSGTNTVHTLGIHQGTEETMTTALGESNVLLLTLQKGYNSPDALAWPGFAA